MNYILGLLGLLGGILCAIGDVFLDLKALSDIKSNRAFLREALINSFFASSTQRKLLIALGRKFRKPINAAVTVFRTVG